MSLRETGSTVFLTSERFEEAKGADVASATTITLGGDGNTFVITGAVTIAGIVTSGWQAGSIVVLRLPSGITVTHNSGAPGAGAAAILMSTAANLVTTAVTPLILIYDGTNWIGAVAATSAGISPAPVDATYITQIPNATLTNEQALSLLGTGVLSSTTATGVVASTTFTTGSVPFGASSILTQDNANFFYDATNHRLMLGGTSPAYRLEVADGAGVSLLRVNTGANPGVYVSDLASLPSYLPGANFTFSVSGKAADFVGLDFNAHTGGATPFITLRRADVQIYTLTVDASGQLNFRVGNALGASSVTMWGENSVSIGTGLLTTSAGGHFHIPTCAGTPTTAPNDVGSPVFAIEIDRTNNRFYGYSTTDAAWRLYGQFTGGLATGLLKNTTGTGIWTIGAAGTDYQAPGNYITALTSDVLASGPGSATATVVAIHETSGPTQLVIGSIPDGSELIRGGASVVGAPRGQVRIDASDTTANYLDSKLIVTSGEVTKTTNNAGGNENLELGLSNFGAGANTYGGAGEYVKTIVVDAKGRIASAQDAILPASVSMFGTYKNVVAPTTDTLVLAPASADSAIDTPFYGVIRATTKARLFVNFDHETFLGGGTLNFTISRQGGGSASNVISVATAVTGLQDSGEVSVTFAAADLCAITVATSDDVVSDLYFSWSLYLYG